MSFTEEFGDTGGPARIYWDVRIGHVLPGITRHNVGQLTPADLLQAVQFFEAKYQVAE